MIEEVQKCVCPKSLGVKEDLCGSCNNLSPPNSNPLGKDVKHPEEDTLRSGSYGTVGSIPNTCPLN